jgi:type IV pilus assembly protein PilN
MIRINLLGVERQQGKRAVAFDISRRVPLASGLILAAALLGLGWWYWSLTDEATRLAADVASAQQELARIRPVLEEVRQGELRRTQLQQRVALIEQLRSGQSVPVQLLDHVSRSLPDMIWLTEMNQDAGAVTITGRSTTLISLSDFVANLGGNASLLKRPIEIVNSQVETVKDAGSPQGQGLDLINFTVKAQIAAQAAPPAGAVGRGAAPPTGAPR